MIHTPRVEIRYCVKCRWLLRAAWTAQELLTTFAEELGEVALVPGDPASSRCASAASWSGRARNGAASRR